MPRKKSNPTPSRQTSKPTPPRQTSKPTPPRQTSKPTPPRQTSKPTKAFSAVLNKVNPGKKVSAKELSALAKKTKLTPQQVIDKLGKKAPNVKIKSAATTFANNYAQGIVDKNRRVINPDNIINGTTDDPSNDDSSNDDSTNNDDYVSRDDLATIFQNLGDLSTDIATIGADADRDVATAYADAQTAAAQFGLEGTKYAADAEKAWRTDVANIEVKGKLDLQPIINAGLARVAEIEGEASRDVAETTGKYSLKSMETRTEAEKDIGKMQLAGGMYGLLGAAFG